jgi:hypothetical protein
MADRVNMLAVLDDIALPEECMCKRFRASGDFK